MAVYRDKLAEKNGHKLGLHNIAGAATNLKKIKDKSKDPKQTVRHATYGDDASSTSTQPPKSLVQQPMHLNGSKQEEEDIDENDKAVKKRMEREEILRRITQGEESTEIHSSTFGLKYDSGSDLEDGAESRTRESSTRDTSSTLGQHSRHI